jgi:hypothetical protein
MLWFPLLPYLSGTIFYIFSFEDTWKSELRTCGQIGGIKALFVLSVLRAALIFGVLVRSYFVRVCA